MIVSGLVKLFGVLFATLAGWYLSSDVMLFRLRWVDKMLLLFMSRSKLPSSGEPWKLGMKVVRWPVSMVLTTLSFGLWLYRFIFDCNMLLLTLLFGLLLI